MARSSAVAALLSFLASCAEYYYFDPKDLQGRFKNVELQAPEDLERRLAAFRSGTETWHGDPRAVADVAIRRHLDVPWKADPFRPREYEIQQSEEWGDFVTRGYRYPSGGLMRYRVKVRSHQEIWYPVQVSYYKRLELDDDPHEH